MSKEKGYERFMMPSVENIPGIDAKAAFLSVDSASVFREQDIDAVKLGDRDYFMPWGADNDMPYRIMELIESDETVSTCLMWNAQMCYGSGLQYNTDGASKKVTDDVEEWTLENSLPSYFLGVAQDMKHWGFAISVIILSKDRKRISRLIRKEACYCRFSRADEKTGVIEKVYYAPWREEVTLNDVEIIPLLNEQNPWGDLKERMADTKNKDVKFAVVTRMPCSDHTYYPIPYWAALFKSNWYDIKRLIALAKKSKIQNSSPIRYLVEISDKYFERLFRQEGLTDPDERRKRVVKAKQEILDFLSGTENSGKTWFANFYVSPDGKENHEVMITRIDDKKEGGDWESDIQESVNMICFTFQVHSNLVGSVPGKSQMNNSGSDKRELYTIAQALQKPYHDLMFLVHRIIIKFNGWKGVKPEVPFIQLTTLDEGVDAKQVKPSNKKNDEDSNE